LPVRTPRGKSATIGISALDEPSKKVHEPLRPRTTGDQGLLAEIHNLRADRRLRPADVMQVTLQPGRRLERELRTMGVSYSCAAAEVPFGRGRSRAIAVVLARRYVRSADVVSEPPVAPLAGVLATVARSRSAHLGRRRRTPERVANCFMSDELMNANSTRPIGRFIADDNCAGPVRPPTFLSANLSVTDDREPVGLKDQRPSATTEMSPPRQTILSQADVT
jgi:hypothetical protein